MFVDAACLCSYVILITNPWSRCVESQSKLRHISFAENMIEHLTGSPVAAVNPRTVKCKSFVDALICDLASAWHKNFSPPTCPFFVVQVLEPTSSTNRSLSGRSLNEVLCRQPKGFVGMLHNFSFFVKFHLHATFWCDAMLDHRFIFSSVHHSARFASNLTQRLLQMTCWCRLMNLFQYPGPNSMIGLLTSGGSCSPCRVCRPLLMRPKVPADLLVLEECDVLVCVYDDNENDDDSDDGDDSCTFIACFFLFCFNRFAMIAFACPSHLLKNRQDEDPMLHWLGCAFEQAEEWRWPCRAQQQPLEMLFLAGGWGWCGFSCIGCELWRA